MLIIIELAFLAFVTVMFIGCLIDFHNEIGSDMINDIKRPVSNWYKNTRLAIWSKNRKNKVKILSEKKYNQMLKEGKIKYVVIEEES